MNAYPSSQEPAEPMEGAQPEAAERDPLDNPDFRSTIQTLFRISRDHVDDEISPAVERIWRYYDGKVDAEPAFFVGTDHEGKKVFHGSKVVVREVWDKVQAVLPDLARIFLGSSEIVQYTPKKPEDEETSAQATDYANYVLWSQNDGEQLLLDALILWLIKFVCLKVYWVEEEKEEKHSFSGVSMAALMSWKSEMDAGGDIVGIDAQARSLVVQTQPDQHQQAMMAQPMQQQPGMPMPPQPEPTPSGLPMLQQIQVFDGTLTRRVRDGHICIEVVPHDEFIIDPDAQKEDVALFVGTDTLRTVSDLVSLGLDYDTVSQYISGGGKTGRSTSVELARRGRLSDPNRADVPDPSLKYVRTIEGRATADADGDGVAETYRVLLLGDDPEPVVAVEGDDLYYVVSSPFRRPHEPFGSGLAEVEMDLQDQLTSLVRGIMNSLNRANNPREIVMDGDIGAYEDLRSPLAGPIRSINPAAVGIHQVPFVGAQAMPIVQYFEERSASRTGVSPAGQGLDPNILKGQTVEGAQAIVTAPQSRIEFLAREFAAGVMRPLFKAILKLSVRFQDKKAIFRLRNRWVEVDPRSWNAEMDAEIKVGLGTGSRSEKFMALMTLKGTQEQLLMQGSPLVTPMEYRETLVEMCGLLGYKDASRFIRDITDEDLAAHAQQQQQAAQQQMQMAVAAKQAEEQAKAQAQMPIEQLKIQASHEEAKFQAAADASIQNTKVQHEAAIEALRAQLQERLTAMEHASKQEIARMQGAITLQVEEQKAALERENMQMEFSLKMREQDQELQLEKAKIKAGAKSGQGNVKTVTD